MVITQWIIFSIMCLLLFSRDKDSQFSAVVLIVAYLFYQAFIVSASDIDYYSYTPFLNLIVGIILQKRNPYAAICSYSLVLWSVGGFFLWYNYYEPDMYDNISLLILILQVITILPTRLLNGLRSSIKHIMAKSPIFNRIQARVTMYKSHPTKETKQ